MRLQQLPADFISNLGDVSIGPEPSNFKDKFARERIAVGVQPGGGQRNQSVSRLDAFAGKKFLAFDRADDKTGKIVFTGRLKAGHLRGLTADEGATGFAARAAHAFDKRLGYVAIGLSQRPVVEERLCRR